MKKKIKYSGRSYLELISQPRFIQAITASAFGYAIMTFLMTATPISMHVMEKMSLSKTGIVIQFHVAAMFLPSLITGHLIKKIGHSNVIYAGLFLYGVTLFMSTFDQSFYNYMIALIFLGLGWNFLFIAGTSLLVLTYNENEKYKAQGLNDFIVYSVHALGSLSAGIFISLSSWKIMNLICIPFIILILVVVFIHEYGHYYFAKKYGVGVNDFSIGFGKEIIGWNDKSGTRWKICWIPLGGYVKFFGDRNVFSQSDQEEMIKKYNEEERKIIKWKMGSFTGPKVYAF